MEGTVGRRRLVARYRSYPAAAKFLRSLLLGLAAPWKADPASAKQLPLSSSPVVRIGPPSWSPGH